MTRKKKRAPKDTTLLSDDLKALRSLKGKQSTVVITTKILDRWIQKAGAIETLLDADRIRAAAACKTITSGSSSEA